MLRSASGSQANSAASSVQGGGGGRGLSSQAQQQLEDFFGWDLSGVRIHTDSSAQRAAQSVGAKAFALGQDVYFGQGHTPSGSLLAHEVSHVVQGYSGMLSGTSLAPFGGAPLGLGSRLEAQAEQHALAWLARGAGSGSSIGQVELTTTHADSAGVQQIVAAAVQQAEGLLSARHSSAGVEDVDLVEIRSTVNTARPRDEAKRLAELIAHATLARLKASRRKQAPGSTVQRAPDDQAPARDPLFQGPAKPLQRYTVIREALGGQRWEALNMAARRREIAIAGYPVPANDPRVLMEIEVPLIDLVRPRPRAAAPSGSLANRVVAAGIASIDTRGSLDQRELAELIQAEVHARWRDVTRISSSRRVKVVLVDPHGQIAVPSMLVLQLDGKTIPSADGSIRAGDLDRRALAGVLQAAQVELRPVEQPLALYSEAVSAQSRARALMGRPLQNVALADTEVWGQYLDGLLGRMRQSPAFLSAGIAQLQAFRSGAFEGFVTSAKVFHATNQPPRSYGETIVGNYRDHNAKIEELGRQKGFGAYIQRLMMLSNSSDQALGMGAYGIVDGFSGGEIERSRHLHEAYRSGGISLKSLEEAGDALTTRGLIHAGVFGALMLATFWCGGPILGAGASVGRQALFYGLSSSAITMGSMAATDLTTDFWNFEDPKVQQLWQQGDYTLGQYALAGATSFALGAAIPAVAWMFARGNALLIQRAAVASQSGGTLPAVSGAQVRTIRAGLIEVHIPGQPGVVQATPTGWRVLAPASEGNVVVSAGTWSELTTVMGEFQGARMSVHGEPFALGVRPGGWVFEGAGTAPQFGSWGTAGGGNALVPWATSAAGRGNPFVLGGRQPLTLAGRGAGNSPLALTGPAFGEYPLALPYNGATTHPLGRPYFYAPSAAPSPFPSAGSQALLNPQGLRGQALLSELPPSMIHTSLALRNVGFNTLAGQRGSSLAIYDTMRGSGAGTQARPYDLRFTDNPALSYLRVQSNRPGVSRGAREHYVLGADAAGKPLSGIRLQGYGHGRGANVTVPGRMTMGSLAEVGRHLDRLNLGPRQTAHYLLQMMRGQRVSAQLGATERQTLGSGAMVVLEEIARVYEVSPLILIEGVEQGLIPNLETALGFASGRAKGAVGGDLRLRFWAQGQGHNVVLVPRPPTQVAVDAGTARTTVVMPLAKQVGTYGTARERVVLENQAVGNTQNPLPSEPAAAEAALQRRLNDMLGTRTPPPSSGGSGGTKPSGGD
ncbi:DUF4157 domain-containing protein [Planctomycetota bacterium]|nr:DUF4157 domain-containing protein [Planctomycetota bacterium]